MWTRAIQRSISVYLTIDYIFHTGKYLTTDSIAIIVVDLLFCFSFNRHQVLAQWIVVDQTHVSMEGPASLRQIPMVIRSASDAFVVEVTVANFVNIE